MAKRNYHLRVRASVRAAWTKRLLIAGAVLIAGFALWRFVVGEMGVVKYYRMSAHARDLRNEIERMKKDNARLSKEVAALKTDTAFLERMARDKIGLARPGEVVYYYGDPLR
jgi:cell division protein FtsB